MSCTYQGDETVSHQTGYTFYISAWHYFYITQTREDKPQPQPRSKNVDNNLPVSLMRYQGYHMYQVLLESERNALQLLTAFSLKFGIGCLLRGHVIV